MNTLCTCCDERQICAEAAARGYQLCVECSTWEQCSRATDRKCRGDGSTEPHRVWEDSPELILCAGCRHRDQIATELDELYDRVVSLAKEHGYYLDDIDIAQSGSRYLTLTDDPPEEEPDDYESDSFVVRISDHGTLYCREEISLVVPSGSVGGDDHTIEALIHRLSRRAARSAT